MYKEEAFYNHNGERVSSKVTQFTGRFHDDKGYSLYAYGNTISGRKSVKFPSEMSKVDIANIALLSKHLALNTNDLVYKSKDKYIPMSRKQIGKVIGIGDRQTDRFLNKMSRLQMIVKADVPIMGGTEERYIMNPLYFLNGKHISDYLYWTFQEQLDQHLSLWIREEYRKRKEGGL